MSYLILGIESSCDDTSAAVIRDEYLLSNVMASQEVHRTYGGVIPELASRAHQQNILPVVDQALKQAGVTMKDIDAIAFTRGPGLLGSLLVGTSFAKNLRKSIFDTVTTFSMAEIKRFSTSSLITRNTNDVNQVRMFIIMGIQMLIKAPVMAIIAINKIANKGFVFGLILRTSRTFEKFDKNFS
jgi:ABC-type multidrug transport system fused ATPase/permease subunit